MVSLIIIIENNSTRYYEQFDIQLYYNTYKGRNEYERRAYSPKDLQYERIHKYFGLLHLMKNLINSDFFHKL